MPLAWVWYLSVQTMKRIFSGAQPTGDVHLGNYLGALRNWVACNMSTKAFLHRQPPRDYRGQDPKLLAEKTRELARIYIAVGIDPALSTIFVQSDVAEQRQLTWVLNVSRASLSLSE